MKFKNIYKETKENVELALLSLWAPGNHRMRRAIKDMFIREPLMAEPVFQSLFPWKQTDDPNWKNYLNSDVINKLGIGSSFLPYAHQTESWKELNFGNSIVVTSGTGSGKTECFMHPVMSDLCTRKSATGQDPVQAIFLYPLNALMQDQKDRLGQDCQKLGLKFCVYNSSLKDRKATEPINQNYPNAEVRTRVDLRDSTNATSCPQILLTNPSMLEYMLVRDADQPIFDRSQGQLRWIVIDEAHTYTGSAAVELAYLIKRVLNAFGVSRDQVRFVCTSATIGDPAKPQELIAYIESIIGSASAASNKRIIPIDGERVVPSAPLSEIQTSLDGANITCTDAAAVSSLRSCLNKQPMSLTAIWNILTSQPYDVEEALELMDKLCDIKVGNDFLLMARGHFFMRAIDGLYACVNKQCKSNYDYKSLGFDYLTTYKGDGHCPECGSPLLEVVQCNDCKEFLLLCEENDKHEVRSCINLNINQNDVDDEEDNDTLNIISSPSWSKLFLSCYPKDRTYFKPHPLYADSSLSFSWDGVKLSIAESGDGDWKLLTYDETLYCPTCAKSAGEEGSRYSHFRVSSNWLNGIIAPAILCEGKTQENDWGKYIAFTDSRQGTAINAKRFNIDAERRYARTHLVKDLSNKTGNALYQQLLAAGISPSDIAKIPGLSPGELPYFSIRQAADCIFNEDMFEHIDFESQQRSGSSHQRDIDAYKTALVRSIIGRRPVHLANIESLGLVCVTYPEIERLQSLPAQWSRSGLSIEDYRSFLKIAIDFVIRMGNHLQEQTPNETQYLRDSDISIPYDPADWPQVSLNDNQLSKIRQHRLVLLLCAGLGIYDNFSLDKRVAEINGLLAEAWTFLSGNILKKVDTNDDYYAVTDNQGNHIYDGWYYLDMSLDSDVCRLHLTEKAWLCPVTNYVLDTTYKGFSPVMKECLSQENLNRYRTSPTQDITMPVLGTESYQDDVTALQQAGVWNDLLKYAYQASAKGYLTAEHSGQQDRKLLDYYTKQFKSTPHKLNLLQCSTTMEMGVDIGDIDSVLMTNVPPTSANYNQRAGRAGRRGQSKAISLSLCPNTSIGAQAFENPIGNLISINPAIIPVESGIIVQRHINSFFIRTFLCSYTVHFHKVHEWLYSNGIYSGYINHLNSVRTNPRLSQQFTELFGSSLTLSQAINTSIQAISDIAADYQQTYNDIDQAIAGAVSQGALAKAEALSIQQTSFAQQDLKGYLAEQQFLPNADMPTGVVEFNHIDVYNYTKLKNMTAELKQKRQDSLDPSLSSGQKFNIQRRIEELEQEIEKIKERSVSSREILIALSEYAPGQTVVINEKNYVSAGIEWSNSFGQGVPWKYLYNCPVCGRYEYSEDPTLTTCPCGSSYQSILNPNSIIPYTLAIEPIRFRTDINRGINRKEKTAKVFYQITTVLTNVDWTNHINGPMCELVGSDTANGEIVLYNQGAGNGFNLCLDCGKMEVSRFIRNQTNWPHDKILERQTACPVNNPKSGVLISGKFPTSFVSLRFFTDSSHSAYVSDTQLLCSLGVVLCRALAKTIGVSDDDLRFDVRSEGSYNSLFIYDTAKGGCGYSTELLDNVICNKVFSEAKQMVANFSCHCEDNLTGACVHCLIDRYSQKYEGMLSKHKLLSWFAGQAMSTNSFANGAQAVPVPLNLLVRDLYSKTSKHDFVFCVDASDMDVHDWASRDGVMGRIINECINRGKAVSIYVSNIPSIDQGATVDTIIPFIDLQSKLPNCNVCAVKTLETSPGVFSALIVNGRDHYFTDTDGVLPFNDKWGTQCTALFEDNDVPQFVPAQFPSASDILLSSDEIIRSMTQKNYVQSSIGRFYLDVIEPNLLKQGDEQTISSILSGKDVEITFSDSYVNSSLAALMLVNLIKQLKTKYRFNIANVELQIQGPKRNCVNPQWNLYNWISWSFPNATDADNYINQLFENELSITPHFSVVIPDHYRWIRLKPVNGTGSIEIRPDYGIHGGWQSASMYWQLDQVDGSTVIEAKNNASIVYYIFIRKH